MPWIEREKQYSKTRRIPYCDSCGQQITFSVFECNTCKSIFCKQCKEKDETYPRYCNKCLSKVKTELLELKQIEKEYNELKEKIIKLCEK